MRLAAAIWQHLGLRIDNTIGLLVSGALPW